MPDEGTSSHAADLLNQAGSTTRDRADQQVRTLAGTLSGVADDLGQMAEGGADPGGSLAGLARDGARFTRTVADRLDRDGLNGALDEVTSFARRRPMLFLAGAFAAGISLGRLTRNADLGGVAQGVKAHVVKDAQPGGGSNGNGGAGEGNGARAAGGNGAQGRRPSPDESQLHASRAVDEATGGTGAGELGAMGLRPEAAGEQFIPGDDDPSGPRL